VRKAISHLNPLQRAHRYRTRVLEQLKERLTAIVDDQDRLRQNLTSAPDGSDLHKRYLGKMTEQEDQIDGLRIAIDDARNAVLKAREAVADYGRELSV
jgi:flagellar biosynthesis chaperone FliJ